LVEEQVTPTTARRRDVAAFGRNDVFFLGVRVKSNDNEKNDDDSSNSNDNSSPPATAKDEN
jgi:hypothetical protein